SQREPGAEGLPSVALLLEAAFSRLSSVERDLLELVALCGRPVARELLLRAAVRLELEPSSLEALGTLKQRALIRAVPGQAYECLHDRVRELVIERLPAPRKRAGHRALADVASAERDGDPEFLAHHYHAAGCLAEAAQYAELAGDRAFGALALE